MKRTFRDLKGQRFGFLTVLERCANVGDKVAWNCRCECGKTVIAKSKNLLNGKQTSCGCQRKKRGIEQLHYVDGSCIEMLQSKTVRSNSKSGVTGVFYDSSSGKWRAEIMLQGKRHYLGRFYTFEEAVKARQRAEEEFHEAFVLSHS